jgi:HSP90 family molecular chaperone
MKVMATASKKKATGLSPATEAVIKTTAAALKTVTAKQAPAKKARTVTHVDVGTMPAKKAAQVVETIASGQATLAPDAQKAVKAAVKKVVAKKAAAKKPAAKAVPTDAYKAAIERVAAQHQGAARKAAIKKFLAGEGERLTKEAAAAGYEPVILKIKGVPTISFVEKADAKKAA